MTKQNYLDYIRQAVGEGRRSYEEQIRKWKESFDPFFMFGYCSPGIIPAQIHMEGLLFKLTGNLEHAKRVKEGLLEVLDLTSIFPEEVRREKVEYTKGVPVLEPLFQLHAYMHAYLYVKDSGLLTPDEHQKVFRAIDQSVSTLEYCPEWGAHNRSMLRACGFVQAAVILGDSQTTRDWLKLADFLAEESMGRWSIEDAILYVALWLFACILYAKWRGIEEEYFQKPQTRFYFDYITQLITPEGNIPGFGDSWFHSNYHIWAACLEMGASRYRCRRMKAAAHRIFEYGRRLHPTPSPGIGCFCVYAYEWADDTVPLGDLAFCSGDLDELVGKKMILRDRDSYLLYNYRDEGYHAWIPRQYLRTSIPVKAEKMHHGHGDEQSVCHLETEGCILLHEGGYREKLPNGKYRADLYHSRLVFRSGLRDLSGSAYKALEDQGFYHHVDTEKLHFQLFDKLDYFRTRLVERNLGLTWDRAITWMKEEGAYIIVDWVNAERDQELTLGNLWHTQHARNLGGGAFETRVDTILRGVNDTSPVQNPPTHSLLVEFLLPEGLERMEPIRRNCGEANMLSQCMSRLFRAGEREIFVTLLTPFPRGTDPSGRTGRLRVDNVMSGGKALSLEYTGKEILHLAYKLDLETGLIHFEEDRSPSYSWEGGRIPFGRIDSDADFSYVAEGREGLSYGMVHGCGVYFDGEELFRARQFTSMDYLKGSFSRIDHKWRAWEGKRRKP